MAEIKAKKVSQLEEINSIKDSERYFNSYLLLAYNNGAEDRDNYKIKASNFISYVYDDLDKKASITLLGNYASQSYLESYYASLDDLENCKDEVIGYLYNELDIAYINSQIQDIADVANSVSNDLLRYTASQYAHLAFHFTHVTATALEDSELDRMHENDTLMLKLTTDNGYELSESAVVVNGATHYAYESQTGTLVINGCEKNIVDVYAVATAKTYNINYRLGRHIQENPNLGHTPQYVRYDNICKISLKVDDGYEITYININDAEFWLTNGSEIWLRVIDSVPDDVDMINVTVQATKSQYTHLQDAFAQVYNEIDEIRPTTAYYDINTSHITILKNNVAYTPYSIDLVDGDETFVLKPDTGYYLPEIIFVDGADYAFNPSTGELHIYNATETHVKIVCTAIPKQNIVNVETVKATVHTHFPTGVYTDEAYSLAISTSPGYKIDTVIASNVKWHIWNESKVVFVPNGRGAVSITVKGIEDDTWSSEGTIDERITELKNSIENLQRQIDYYHSDATHIMWIVENVILSEMPDIMGDDSYEITLTPAPGYSLPAKEDIITSGIIYEYTPGEQFGTLRLLRAQSPNVAITIIGVPKAYTISYKQTIFTYTKKPVSVKMGDNVSFILQYDKTLYNDPICTEGNIARDGAIINAKLLSSSVNENNDIITATYIITPTGGGNIQINAIEERLMVYHFGIVGDESLFIMQQGFEIDGQPMEYPVSLRAGVDLSSIAEFVTTNGYNPFSESTYQTYRAVHGVYNDYKYIIVPKDFISIEDEIYMVYNNIKYKIVFDPYANYNDHGVPQPNGNSKSIFDPETNVEGYVYPIGKIDAVDYYAIYFDLTDSDTVANFALITITE